MTQTHIIKGIFQASWKYYLPGQSLSLHSWISHVLSWHFPPFLSWTILTRVLFFVPLPHVAEQDPCVQADHSHGISEKETFFVTQEFPIFTLSYFPIFFHTYLQLKIGLREHVSHDPGHLFWINDEQWQSTLGSISLHQFSLSSHFRSKDWKFDDLFSFSLKLDGFNYGWWYEDK